MEHIEVTTPGMKIKKIRTQFKIKQSELSGKDITRNLISLIENDKANLTLHSAKIISENINIACQKREIDFSISANDLLESAEIQLENYLSKFRLLINMNEIEFINGSFDGYIVELEEILTIYNLTLQKFNMYVVIGDSYKKNKDFYKSYIFYTKAYQESHALSGNIELSRIILNIGYCCIQLKRYKEAIDFNRIAYIYTDNLPEDIKVSILFNTALAYKKINDYNNSLNTIKIIEQQFYTFLKKDLTLGFNINMLKANCLKELNLYTDSIAENLSLLDSIPDKNIEFELVIYCNLLEIYINLNDTKALRTYIDKCLTIIDLYCVVDETQNSSEIYNDIGLAAYKINNTDLAKEYFSKALLESKKNKNSDIIASSLENLLYIYISDNNEIGIDYLKTQLCEVLSSNVLNYYNTLALKFINYYNSINDKESIDNLIRFILRL